MRIIVKVPLEPGRWFDLATCDSVHSAQEIIRIMICEDREKQSGQILLDYDSGMAVRFPRDELLE